MENHHNPYTKECPEHICKKREEYLSGKMIEPLRLEGNDSVSDFIKNVFGYSGYNARRLAEACETFKAMIDDGATICLTVAGAMTPIGMSGPIIRMMELGFVDFIISTGANLYHDLHRPYDFPMKQGEVDVDDGDLYNAGIARIYDVFIRDDETLMATDKSVLDAVEKSEFSEHERMSTAELHNKIGKVVQNTAKCPEKSILANAAKLDVPIYTSSPGDSSIGMNYTLPWLFGHKVPIDPILDVIETTSIVREGTKNGVIIIGGGSPKNFYLQTQPTLWQIFWDESKGGHDYFVQLTTDSPQWGGLSGATPMEAKSWGKVKDATKNNVVVYSCASLTFPLICKYVEMNCKPRPRKELYKKLGEFKKNLFQAMLKNKKLMFHLKKDTDPLVFERIYRNYFEEADKEDIQTPPPKQ